MKSIFNLKNSKQALRLKFICDHNDKVKNNIAEGNNNTNNCNPNSNSNAQFDTKIFNYTKNNKAKFSHMNKNYYLNIEKAQTSIFNKASIKSIFFKKKKSNLSELAENYWSNIEINSDSMVGVPEINNADINNTISLLDKYYKRLHKNSKSNEKNEVRCLEISCGIGRVTVNLSDYFHTIDVIEPYKRFTDELIKRKELKNKIGLVINKKIEDVTEQDFEPIKKINDNNNNDDDEETPANKDNDNEAKSKIIIQNEKKEIKYNLIFAQWCFEYISDEEVLSNFLQILKSKLKETTYNDQDLNSYKKSYLIVKENTNDKECCVEEEGSLIRTKEKWNKMFLDAGFNFKENGVLNVPGEEDLFPINYWVLESS